MTSPANAPRPKRKIWNYTPQLPIQTSPYWDWPMKPLAALRYLLQSWNPLALRAFLLGFAIAARGLQTTYALAGDTDGIDGSENNAGAFVDAVHELSVPYHE